MAMIALGFQSCENKGPVLSKTEKEQITQQIRQTLNDYFHDVSKGGLLEEFRYLDSSEAFFWKPPGYDMAIDFDSVRRILVSNAGKFKKITNSLDSLMVLPLTVDLAVYKAWIHSEVVDMKGQTTNISLYENACMLRKEGRWKLLNGSTSVLHN
jgi:hypothetical protein